MLLLSPHALECPVEHPGAVLCQEHLPSLEPPVVAVDEVEYVHSVEYLQSPEDPDVQLHVVPRVLIQVIFLYDLHRLRVRVFILRTSVVSLFVSVFRLGIHLIYCE